MCRFYHRNIVSETPFHTQGFGGHPIEIGRESILFSAGCFQISTDCRKGRGGGLSCCGQCGFGLLQLDGATRKARCCLSDVLVAGLQLAREVVPLR